MSYPALDSAVEVGAVFDAPWYGASRVTDVRDSGGDCVKVTYEPLEEAWRVPNPPGIIYVRKPSRIPF